MSKDRKQFRDDPPDDDGAGWINRFLAEEDQFDGRAMWRLASWGAGSVAALLVAILATRSPAAINRDQMAAAELTRQSQQVQWIAKESQNKARELAAAVDVLNGDRDRLYTRVTILEQGLDSVTGALSRPSAPAVPAATAQPTAPSAAEPAQALPSASADPIGPFRSAETRPAETKAETSPPLPKIAPVASIAPATMPIAPAKPAEQKIEMPASDPSPPPVATASIPPDPSVSDLPAAGAGIVRRTEFGVDLGAAKSIEGLRAVWRGAIKSNPQHLASLQPIIVVKERTDGLGMQLRLVAGPLADAAEAAKICAGLLTESNRACETSIYEGQRLNLTVEKTVEKTDEKAVEEPAVQRQKRRSRSRGEAAAEKPKTSSFSSFFGGR
ncbi:hypothetical protein BH10PSE10_BH10PSE10_10360 [soil metagenome]